MQADCARVNAEGCKSAETLHPVCEPTELFTALASCDQSQSDREKRGGGGGGQCNF